jgi:hypothetical protein
LVVGEVQRERIKQACEGLPMKGGQDEHGNS